MKDINTQVLETKYVINLGQLLKIVLDIKQYIFKPVKTIQLVQLVQLEPTYVAVVINHQMDVIQVQIGKNFIDDVLIHGGSRINILTMNLRV